MSKGEELSAWRRLWKALSGKERPLARSQDVIPGPAPCRATFTGQALYLVRRVYEVGWDSVFVTSAASACSQRGEWGAPIKAFTGRTQAEALCEELGKKLLGGMSPFQGQGSELADVTSLPADLFRDWLLDVGLEPPPTGKNQLEDWARWWKENRPGMSAAQRHRVVGGLDKLRHYAVVELPPPASTTGREAGLTPARAAPVRAAGTGTSLVDVFTVELLLWHDDDLFLLDQEQDWVNSLRPCFSPGGAVRLATFRDHGRAVSYRDELQRQVPEGSRDYYRNGFGVTEHPIEVED